MTTTTEVPGRFDVAVDGRGFMVDWDSEAYRHESIPLLRAQADASALPGESSINPDDLWRRNVVSWHKGAGQRYFDTPESDRSRFWRSFGVDVWTEGQLTLLPQPSVLATSANTNTRLVTAGSYLYAINGAQIQYTQDASSTITWSNITGEPATASQSIASDGNRIWTAHGADGLYQTTRGAGSTANFMNDGIDHVRWAKGRLFGWEGNTLYNIVDIASGAPSAKTWADQDSLLAHPNTDFTWVDVAGASNFYYAAGYSGDKSLIYRTEVKADGTSLDALVVAGELPDGEVVRAVYGYLGFLLIGTDIGVRFAVPNSAGDLTIGGLIETGSPVHAFEGQGSYVWFGWGNFDGNNTGMGRMDLSVFNGSRPAYATDVMTTSGDPVLSIVTFDDERVFAVSGDVYGAYSGFLEAEGWVETGRLAFGLHDRKISHAVSVVHEPLEQFEITPGGFSIESIQVELSTDGAAYVDLGTNQTAGSAKTNVLTDRAAGETFEVKVTLAPMQTAVSPATYDSPVVNRITLRADPTGPRSERVRVPLLVGFSQVDRTGRIYGRKADDDVAYLAALEATGETIDFQEPQGNIETIPVDHLWVPHHVDEDGESLAGTYVLEMKRFATS